MIINELTYTAQKMKFAIKDFFSKCDQIRSILNGKLHFFCSDTFLFQEAREYLLLSNELTFTHSHPSELKIKTSLKSGILI